jgi:hypothetical protein
MRKREREISQLKIVRVSSRKKGRKKERMKQKWKKKRVRDT